MIDATKETLEFVQGLLDLLDEMSARTRWFLGYMQGVYMVNETERRTAESTENNDNELCDLALEGGSQDMPQKLHYGEGTVTLNLKNANGKQYRYWLGRVTIQGKRYTVQSNISQADCIAKLRKKRKKVIAELEKEAQRGEALPFGDWLDVWFPTFKTRISENTKKEYLRMIDEIRAALGAIPIRDLNCILIQQFINRFDGKPNTQKKYFGLLKSVLDAAIGAGKLATNPMLAVKKGQYRRQKKECYDWNQQRIMLDQLAPKYKAAFFLLCSTGLRVGEFCALEITDFDLIAGKLAITKQRDSKTGELMQQLKTATSRRVIRILPDLIERAAEYDPQIGDHLGGFTYAGLKKAFGEVIRANGMEGVSIHSTRHTFSSVCHAEGIDDKQLQAWLGHATLAMTSDTYTHLLEGGTSPIREYIARLK